MSESRALAKPSPAAGPLRPESLLADLASVLPFPLAAILVYNFQHWTMSGPRQMDKNASDGTFAVFLEALSGEELAHTIVQLHPDIARGRIADRLAIAPGVPVIRLKESHYSVYEHLVADRVVFFSP